MRVLIADSEQGFRRFIRRILERQPDLNVAGQASDAEEVVQLAQQLKPDVVLMDIDLPGLDGLEATRRIKASLPGTKVIMLSAVDGETYRNTAAKHGAPRLPRCFLSSGTEARQRLRQGIFSFAREIPRFGLACQ